jgi:VanZ family protein
MMKIKTVSWIIWTLALLAILLSPMRVNIFPAEGFRYWDKVVHIGLFVVTGFMSIFGASFFSKFGHRFIFAIVIGLVLAAGTELGQSLVPHRTTDVYDFLADVVGLCFSLLVYALLYRNESIRSRLRL